MQKKGKTKVTQENRRGIKKKKRKRKSFDNLKKNNLVPTIFWFFSLCYFASHEVVNRRNSKRIDLDATKVRHEVFVRMIFS